MFDTDELRTVAETSRAIWAIAAALFVAVCFSYWIAHLSYDFLSGLKASVAIAGCVAISVCYRRWRPDPWISNGAECTAQIAVIMTLGVLISYPLAALSFPYRDAELHAIDRALGLDWRAYLGFFSSHPLFSAACKLAYCSMRCQYLLVIVALVATSNFRRLQRYIIATTLALTVTLIIFAFVPAVGSYVFLNIEANDYVSLMPSVTSEQARHLQAMRTAADFLIAADKLEGLISFPSFHTVCGLLFTWAVWPVKPLRWWIAGLNAMMIAAVPIEGAHYFVDAIGGAVVAACAVYGSTLLSPKLSIGIFTGPLRLRTKDRVISVATPSAR
jgi:membrane-associated phospholipid phosphatase